MAILFFFNDTATTEIYTLSLHDALPISISSSTSCWRRTMRIARSSSPSVSARARSEEHTSELQSHLNLVCRLLLEKKKSSPHTRRQRQIKAILLTPHRTKTLRRGEGSVT